MKDQIAIDVLMQNCLNHIASVTAQCHYYHWSDKFIKEEIERSVENCTKHLSPRWNEIKQLSRETLSDFGFLKWDGDLILIPLWLFDCIPEGEELICIDGETVIKNGDNIDNDARFGCIAYGFEKK